MEQESVLTACGEDIPRELPSKKKKRPFRKEWIWCYVAIGLPFFGFIFFNAFPIIISFAAMYIRYKIQYLEHLFAAHAPCIQQRCDNKSKRKRNELRTCKPKSNTERFQKFCITEKFGKICKIIPLHGPEIICILIIIIVSFEPDLQFAREGFQWWPDWAAEGYTMLFDPENEFINMLLSGFFNSLWQTLIPTVGGLFVSGMAAYAYAKWEFPGKNKFFALCLVLRL